MDALYLVRRMARNEAWANFRLANAIAGLSEAEYRRADRTSFFPSIHLTLSHVWWVGEFYVDALVEGGRGASVWAESDRCDAEGTFAMVRAGQAELDRRLIRWCEELRDGADLDVPVRLQRRDHVQVESRGDVLMHLFQHSVHHRGQVHAMLSGTAVKPPQLDEFHLREELPLREAELRALGLPLE